MESLQSSYTISGLMNIDASRQEKASYCQVELVKTYHELALIPISTKQRKAFNGKTHLWGYFLVLKLKVTSDSGKVHTVFIKLNPDFDLNKWDQNRIQIYCDCADFKFRSAWVLNDKNSLFLNDRVKIELGSSLTETPKKTTKTSLLCKHAFAALSWLVNNYMGIMRTV